MPKIASWIREKDQDYFQSFLQPHPGLEFLNARTANAGGAPVNMADAEALLITGGPDISAGYLKQIVPDASLIVEPGPERDEWEFAALRKALESGKPIFAVCKGFQVLNVELGGTLLLDIPGHNLPEARTGNIQPLRHSASSSHRLPLVNSSHHQALDKVASGLEVEAWCSTDDIIEQVKLRGYPYCFGVQYHPERHPIYTSLFEDFFAHILT